MVLREQDIQKLDLGFSGVEMPNYGQEPEVQPLVSGGFDKKTGRKTSLRRKAMALAAVAISAFFPFNDSPSSDRLQMTHSHSEPLRGDNLRVMTANVHGWQGQHGNNVDSLLAAMDQEKPDVACLQEVFADGDELSQLYHAGYNVLFAKTQDYILWGRFGNAVVSRHPLQLDTVTSLPNPDTDNPRRALVFEIQTEHESLKFADLHLSPNANESRLQTEVFVDSLSTPILGICGDFNQGGQTLMDGRLGTIIPSSWFKNSITKAAPGNSARGAIDWVLSTCGTRNTDSPELVDIDSDHFGLVEDINLVSCIQS